MSLQNEQHNFGFWFRCKCYPKTDLGDDGSNEAYLVTDLVEIIKPA
jgi:hypothetical protein